MSSLPASLLKKLKRTLLECGPFSADRSLIAVFSDERIAPWKHRVSGAYNPRERVDLFVSDFLPRRNRVGQSVLVLFIQVLHDQSEDEDACQQRLDDVAIEVAAALQAKLPPLARHNILRATAVTAGEDIDPALGGYVAYARETTTTENTQVASLPTDLPVNVFAEKLESLKKKGQADWLSADFLEKGLKAAHAVGRVEHQGRKIGTAFLVTPDLVLTNAHVVRDIPVLIQGGVRFNVGLQTEDQWRYFLEEEIYSPIEDLDFALVRLKDPLKGVLPVNISSEKAYPDQPANILQFPAMAGGFMQVALRYNAVVYIDATRLYYVTDTDEGSSGSPVFNDDWCVIALHRAGIVDGNQRPVKSANQGVPLTAIEPIIRPYFNGG